MEKKRSKKPLTRPKFTEKVQETRLNDVQTQPVNDERATELIRLEKMPRVPGRITIQMMEEFKMFPWTQNTMLMIGQLDAVLMEYLTQHVEINEEELEQ